MGAKEEAHILRLRERLEKEFLRPMVDHFFRVLAEELGGVRMTLPSLRDHYRMERNRRIRNEFNGANLDDLAIRYRMTVRQVRRVVGRG